MIGHTKRERCHRSGALHSPTARARERQPSPPAARARLNPRAPRVRLMAARLPKPGLRRARTSADRERSAGADGSASPLSGTLSGPTATLEAIGGPFAETAHTTRT